MRTTGSKLHEWQKILFVSGVRLIFLIFTFLPTLTYGEEMITYDVKNREIYVKTPSSAKTCELDEEATYAVSSYDKSALIVSAEGYVPFLDVYNCETGKIIRVHKIPENVETLSDINISKGVYVALDFVSIRPFSYVATVARLGSRKNLVSIEGAAAKGRKPNEEEHSFSIDGDMVGSSIISLDGRYVSPNKVIDCGEDASPGVWDIYNNSKVRANKETCENLFK